MRPARDVYGGALDVNRREREVKDGSKSTAPHEEAMLTSGLGSVSFSSLGVGGNGHGHSPRALLSTTNHQYMRLTCKA